MTAPDTAMLLDPDLEHILGDLAGAGAAQEAHSAEVVG